MPMLISSEGHKIHIDDNHILLKNPIISQFNIKKNLPIPFEHLQLLVNDVDDVIRDEKFILYHIELLKKLVLENDLKLYLLKYYESFNNLKEDIYQYLTIYDMHLLNKKYVDDFLNGRFNYASQDEKDKIIKIKRIKDIMMSGNHRRRINMQINMENNIKNKNDYKSIIGDEIITIPYIIKILLECHLCKIIKYASDDVKNNFEFIKFACSINGAVLKYASDKLKNNFEIVKTACSNYGWALQYASVELKNNYKIVKIACYKHPNALEHASSILKNNFKIVKIACSRDGWALKHASDQLKNNFEIVGTACSTNGLAIYHISEQLKNNFEIVKIACSNYGRALQFASDELKNNFEIVKIACLKNDDALQFASDEVKNKFEIVKMSLYNDRYALYVNDANNFGCSMRNMQIYI